MKVQKYEIARVIDKLKSIVQKNDQCPALGGVLVKDGYLIASNADITMKVKLEASEGNYFIIPMKAFDLIKNLPDGEVDISEIDHNVIQIKTRGIKNKYQSYPPEEFIFDITEDPEAEGVKLNGKKIMEAIRHVIYAAADGGSNTQMTGIYFEGTSSGVSLVALDGHVVAVDSVPGEGMADMKLIVPKTTAKKLISMGVIDDVTLTYTKNSVVFESDEYSIYTRLIEGKYFQYQKMFTVGEINTCASRTALIGAMTRAKMCTEEKQPAVFQIEGDVLSISIRDKLADYQEQVPLQETVYKSIRLGFDSKLVLETLKAFTCDNITLGFTSPRTPMIVEAEDSDMKAMVLPVVIREEKHD
ncbi:DNA polymerase III subunit beta [Parablautia sp. Marseille-Q6255]|uniref:DNA polymerase III subunit beta n=1 Tax=Parablautia sp. Marseille-Q6255 TaxID=3039593 RepID=UPI0024BC6978|nr:DNA polymerase III subunit beta [Parablautia sp. Marseille-Q6255]